MSEKPKRIQRKRTKGWKMPRNTVCVTRPGKWGNPFKVQRTQLDDGKWYWEVEDTTGDSEIHTVFETRAEAVEVAIAMFRADVDKGLKRVEMYRELRGKDLCCWCKPGEPCHADVLLEIANV